MLCFKSRVAVVFGFHVGWRTQMQAHNHVFICATLHVYMRAHIDPRANQNASNSTDGAEAEAGRRGYRFTLGGWDGKASSVHKLITPEHRAAGAGR